MTSERVVAIVPAKGRSTRVPGKNLRLMAGKPMVGHILDTLQRCTLVDEVYLDSDSPVSLDLGRSMGVPVIERPPQLASDATNGNHLLLFHASRVEADIYLQTFATNPLLRAATIDRAIERLLDSPAHDSLFGVVREHAFFWNDRGPVNYDPATLPRTQDLPPFYRETTGLYLIRRPALLSRRARIGARPVLFEVDPIEATDVDYEHDFRRAESLLVERQADAELEPMLVTA